MPQKVLRPPEQRMPPAINIIALANFAASLSARALDPVLPIVLPLSRTQLGRRPIVSIQITSPVWKSVVTSTPGGDGGPVDGPTAVTDGRS